MTNTPYLVLTVTASPMAIGLGGTSVLTASFLTDSSGNAISAANLQAMTGVPITYTGPSGSLSAMQPAIQASGTATANFGETLIGFFPCTVAVDDQRNNVYISVFNPVSHVRFAGHSGTSASLNVSGVVGLTYSIQASEGLHSWTTIGSTQISATGSNIIVDSNAPGYPHRFYRVVYP